MNKHIKRVIAHFKRQQVDPRYLARSNAMGMSLAFAPFPGQTPIIFALWLLFRKTKWRFSLAISIAWSFISNIFTNLPLFYIYYITGNSLRDQQNQFDYRDIKSIFADNIGHGINYLLNNFAVSIFIGSLFYMLSFGTLGYLLGIFIYKKNKKQC